MFVSTWSALCTLYIQIQTMRIWSKIVVLLLGAVISFIYFTRSSFQQMRPFWISATSRNNFRVLEILMKCLKRVSLTLSKTLTKTLTSRVHLIVLATEKYGIHQVQAIISLPIWPRRVVDCVTMITWSAALFPDITHKYCQCSNVSY